MLITPAKGSGGRSWLSSAKTLLPRHPSLSFPAPHSTACFHPSLCPPPQEIWDPGPRPHPACSPGTLGLPGPLPQPWPQRGCPPGLGSIFRQGSISLFLQILMAGQGQRPRQQASGATGLRQLGGASQQEVCLLPTLCCNRPQEPQDRTQTPVPPPRLGQSGQCPELHCLISNPDCQK